MAVQSIPALQNISCATGNFAATGHRRATQTHATRQQRKFDAMATYNRRPSAFQPAMAQRIPETSSVGGFPSASRSPFFTGGPSLQRMVSHIGRPRFNALARLASSALRSTGDGRYVTSASAAVAAAPAKQQPAQPTQVSIPQSTPFASQSQVPLAVPPAPRDINSDLGFRTDFQTRFSLGIEIGSGSFGTVYSATDIESGEAVAVKVLPKDSSGSGTRSRRGSGRTGRDIILNKVKKELDVLQRLQLSGCAVELLGTFEDHQFVYVVMEECVGGDLEQLLEDHGPLREADVARAMFEVLQTLASCHSMNLYHGDIKPANFMLKDAPRVGPQGVSFDKCDPNGWLKAIDFGCTQYVEPGQPLSRKTGTPMFMAPEVFIGNYGLEADMWAAGMTMYQLLADRFPWWSTMEELHTTTLEAVMEAVIQKDIPMDFGPFDTMSAEGKQLLCQLLERDAAKRVSATDALRHPWFQKFGLTSVSPARTASSNILPLGRGFSETLRLRMASAELSRARSRPPSGLSGLLDDMLKIESNEPAGSLRATLA